MGKGRQHGPAIVPGDPEKSLLIQAVRYTDPNLQMPPESAKLPTAQINDLVTWVSMGAPDPRTTRPVGEAEPTAGAARTIGHSSPSRNPRRRR